MKNAKSNSKKANKANAISVCAQTVKDAKVPTDPKAVLTMPQAAKLLGVTQYHVYTAVINKEVKDKTLASWTKYKKQLKTA